MIDSICDSTIPIHEDIELTVKNGTYLRISCREEQARLIARRISLCYGCENEHELNCVECLKEWLDKPYVI